MAGQRDGKLTIAIIVFIALIVGLVMINNWLQKKAADIVTNPTIASTAKPLPPPVPAPKKVRSKRRTGEVLRKTRLAPDRTYETNTFYQAGDKIAEHKTSQGMVYDQTGEIPDGKVKFINETNETFGVEYYDDNLRHGPAKTYYREGELRYEAYYHYGRLVRNKEYYKDGILRMEEDYTDAREFRDDRETGAGKVYFRDGTIKYEWYFIQSNPMGFRKSYNRYGKLVDEIHYDRDGQVIQPRVAPVPVVSEEAPTPN